MPLSKAYKAPILAYNETSIDDPSIQYIWGDLPVTPQAPQRRPRMIPQDLSTEFDLSSIPSKAPKKSLPYVTPERIEKSLDYTNPVTSTQERDYIDSLRGFTRPTDIPDRDIPGLPYREITDYYNMAGIIPSRKPAQVLEEQSIATAKPEDIVTTPRILVKKDPTGQQSLDLPGIIVVGQYAPDFKGEESDIPPDIKDPKALPENTLPDFKTFLQNLQNTSDTAAKSESAALDPLFKLMSRTAASTGVYRGEMPKPLLPQFIDEYKAAEKQKIDNELSKLKIQAQIDANKSLAAQREFEAQRKREMLPVEIYLKKAQADFLKAQDEQKLFQVLTEKEAQDPMSERSQGIKAGIDLQMQMYGESLKQMGRDPTPLLSSWRAAKETMSGADALRFAFQKGVDINPIVKNYSVEQQGARQLTDIDFKTREAELTRQHQAAMAAKKAEYEKELAKIRGEQARITNAAKPLGRGKSTDPNKNVVFTEGGINYTEGDIKKELENFRKDPVLQSNKAMQIQLQHLEDSLPFRLQDIITSPDGKVKVKAKDGRILTPEEALPGDDRGGLGYLTEKDMLGLMVNPNMADAKFQRFYAALMEIRNKELKDQSGAAVSVGEYERFKSGKLQSFYTTKKLLLEGLKRLQNQVDTITEDRISMFNPEVVKILKNERGLDFVRPGYRFTNPKLIKLEQVTPAATVTAAPGQGIRFFDTYTNKTFRTTDQKTIDAARKSKRYQEVK